MKALKRIAVCFLMTLLILPKLPCAAESGFYCEYTPKTETGSVFYIDLYSADAIRAAVMELYFDDSLAAYREVSAVGGSASVRAVCDGGCVKLAFTDSSAVSGELCRVAFKALQTGVCSFTLHLTQAADSEPRTLAGFSDYTLDVKLGKDDIAASYVSAEGSTSASSGKSGASSQSSISTTDTGEDGAQGFGGYFDMRDHHRALTYILAGAAVVLIVGGLIFAGIMIGRRTERNKLESRNEGENERRLDYDPMEEIDFQVDNVWDDETPME